MPRTLSNKVNGEHVRDDWFHRRRRVLCSTANNPNGASSVGQVYI